jgi:hypothetical protein
MTHADILIKLPRRQLADMVIELEHQVNNSEERSFDYAARLIRVESTLEAHKEASK